MGEFSIFEWFGITYFCLAFAKTVLCLVHVPMVMGVLDRRLGKTNHALRALGIFTIVPIFVTVVLPKMIWDEGLSFFVIYSKTKVIRDMLSAF